MRPTESEAKQKLFAHLRERIEYWKTHKGIRKMTKSAASFGLLELRDLINDDMQPLNDCQVEFVFRTLTRMKVKKMNETDTLALMTVAAYINSIRGVQVLAS